MYFLTSAAKQLVTVPALPDLPPEPVIYLCPSPRKSLFCILTKCSLSVWRVRPYATLAYLSRTPASILDHGENVDAHWSPDSTRLAIRTSSSYIIAVTVKYEADETAYVPVPLPATVERNFLLGPGESSVLRSTKLKLQSVTRIDGTLLSVSPRKKNIVISTENPATVRVIPWSPDTTIFDKGEDSQQGDNDTWLVDEANFPWLIEQDVFVAQILHVRSMAIDTWITSDGRAYFVRLNQANMTRSADEHAVQDHEQPYEHIASDHAFGLHLQKGWQGTCVHTFKTPKWVQKQRRIDVSDPVQHHRGRVYEEARRAVTVAINNKFSLVAIGTSSGGLEFTNFPSENGITPKSQTVHVPNSYDRPTGEVHCLEWTSDGYVLAVGWRHGWGIFSVGGRCLASGFGIYDTIDGTRFQDEFMHGVKYLFWAPGNFELFVLPHSYHNVSGQLCVIPFAKSATTGQHSPDNTRYAFLQMEDRALVYRGADQPDMSVINPEADVWQHIKIPRNYLMTNWPIRYSSISSDGRLIAVAGRRGLIHYSTTSGRWKMFADQHQEQAFAVKGGLLWFHHVLIVAVEISNGFQVRLFSRDLELSNGNILHREVLTSPVVILSIVDNSLLVYAADNTLFHYLVIPTAETIKLHMCGSMTFNGIISAPTAVRMLSWMIPSAQKQLGDPVDDLSVATVLMVVGGQLILLRPRKSATQEVRYDMQIFSDRVEFCWIHLRGINTLENSLWAYDGRGIRVWLNALAIETLEPEGENDEPENVKESMSIPLDFYPLSVLMDKGIIIGVEHETVARANLPFVMFRYATSSHLFLHHILQFLLSSHPVEESVLFASNYEDLVYFAHALEILLHNVVEAKANDTDEDGKTSTDAALSTVIQFLDYFDVALDVVVGCARKTELTRWRHLFNVVGNPKFLFEACLASRRLRTAGSYLLVLHNLEQLNEDSEDAVRLLKSAVESQDWQLCRELLRFLHSVDDSGHALRKAVAETHIIDDADSTY